MDDLRDFLNWFEGFSDNIGKAPTPTQWGKIKDRLSRLKKLSVRQQVNGVTASHVISSAPPPPTDAPANDPYAKPPPEPPRNEEEWMSQYRDALVEYGLDDESAMDDSSSRDADMSVSPLVAARLTAIEYGLAV